MEYLLVHGGSRGHNLQYELLYDGNGENLPHTHQDEPEDPAAALLAALDAEGEEEADD